MRYLNLWLRFAHFSLMQNLEYKANFLVDMVVEIGWSLVTLFAIEIIFYTVDSIAGWSKGEIVLVYAFYRLSSAITTIFLRKNIFRFPLLINSGEFDLYLTKPVDPLFMAMFRMVSLDRLIQVVTSIFVFMYGFSLLSYSFGMTEIVGIIILVPVVGLIRLCLEIITVTPVFWLQKLENIYDVIFTFFTPARFPRQAYPALFVFIFTYIYPVLFVGAIPVEIVFKKAIHLIPVTFLVAVILFIFMRLFFKRALKAYASASS